MKLHKFIIFVFAALLATVSVHAEQPYSSKHMIFVQVFENETKISAWEVNGTEPFRPTFSFVNQWQVNGTLVRDFDSEHIFIGRHGATNCKKEGDGCTPFGTFTIWRAFGLMPDPGTSLEYKQIQEGDVWVDDPQSSYYNQFIGIDDDVERDWESAEDLYKFDVEYRYAFVIEHNTKKPVPGAGSAIFFHCEENRKTAGCVAVAEDDMVWILQWLRPGDIIVIAPGNTR